MTRAVTRLDEAPTSLLLGPVGRARLDPTAQLDELGRSVHAAHLLLQGLPEFLGSEGRQRYFFGAQDPAELRGTGGLIGAYSVPRPTTAGSTSRPSSRSTASGVRRW